MPAYIPHIGGNYEGGEVIFGTRLKSRLPAKRVPEAVERWLRLYEAERAEGEEFNAFVERVGAERFEAEVKDLTLPAEFSLETMQQFIDWNRSEPLQGRARRGRVRGMSPVAAAVACHPLRHDRHRPRRSPPSSRTAARHEAIEWMFETFGESHYIACSFQKTSSVTAHLATQVDPDARFFYLDTDVLFPETYETRDRLAEQLGIEFDRYHNISLAEQAEKPATSSGSAIPTPAAGCARSSRCAGPSLP